MKTRELRTDQGELIGFIISNLLLSRHGVSSVVEAIDGARVLRKQKRFAIFARDDFCEFMIDGETFLAIEPFGDNSEFWVVSEPPKECPQLKIVWHAFEQHSFFGRLNLGKLGRSS
jgi:hypothetical protein